MAVAILLIIIIIFVIIGKFSAIETKYECIGSFSKNSKVNQMTIYMKLQRYRWWVDLWSDSDGSIWIEGGPSTCEYFEKLKKIGDLYQIFDLKNKERGTFSILSNSLYLEFPGGTFTGQAKEIVQY